MKKELIKINTTHIEDMPMPVKGNISAELLELNEESGIHPAGKIQYDLFAAMTGQDMLVTGKASLQIETECARCLDPIQTSITVPDVCHLYEGVAGQEVEISQDIREDILLAMPLVFKCTPKCKGICTGCGANLNHEKCTCSAKNKKTKGGKKTGEPETSSPWDALSALNLGK